jgi:hypothetical protein
LHLFVLCHQPFGGGRLSPKRAFTYVFDFNVEGCMFGVGSVAELKEDYSTAVNVSKEVNLEK